MQRRYIPRMRNASARALCAQLQPAYDFSRLLTPRSGIKSYKPPIPVRQRNLVKPGYVEVAAFVQARHRALEVLLRELLTHAL